MKLKKIVSLGLAVVMLLGTLVGCGKNGGDNTQYSDNPDEVVTLSMVIPSAKQKDADKVVAQVNKELETLLPNTKLEVTFEANLGEKWALWMSTNKKIDIAHSGFSTVLADEVLKGGYMELDSLIDKYAPTLKEHNEKYWYAYDTARINEKLYAVPNVQSHIKDALTIEFGNGFGQYVDVDALEQEGQSNDKTTERFWQIVDEAYQKAEAAGYDCKGTLGVGFYTLAQKGYVFIGGEKSNLCYEKNSDEGKIIDFYTTEEFKVFCKYMKKWADKGYVSPDALTGNVGILTTRKLNTYYVDEATGQFTQSGEVPTNIIIEDYKENVLTTDTGGISTYWSIPITAEHPARAIKFLDLLHSEKGAVIANLLAYGIEGEHYEFTNEEYGEIKAFEYDTQGGSSVSYGIPNWMIANMMQGMYNISVYDHEYTEYADYYYTTRANESEKHVLYGLSFDTSVVKAEWSKILKNNNDLARNIYSGFADDLDATLEELIEKNKAAGIEKVMEELQKQADEYKKKQK